MAGNIVPIASPNPILAAPSFSQNPRKITLSPSSMKVRLSPLGSWTGLFPPRVNSNNEPAWSERGRLVIREVTLSDRPVEGLSGNAD